MKVSIEEENVQGQDKMVLKCTYRAMVGYMQNNLQALLTLRSTDRGFAPRVSGAKSHEWLQANDAQS